MHRTRLGLTVLLAAILIGPLVAASAQEIVIGTLDEASLAAGSPFAVGGEARKPLPPVDCWSCPGPPAWAPCDAHSAGFLYYATDPGLGRGHCPDGECGGCAVALARSWIHWQEHQSRLLKRSHAKCDRECHECQP